MKTSLPKVLLAATVVTLAAGISGCRDRSKAPDPNVSTTTPASQGTATTSGTDSMPPAGTSTTNGTGTVTTPTDGSSTPTTTPPPPQPTTGGNP